MPEVHVETRRARILEALDRVPEPVPPSGEPPPPERIEYFVREAEELYWNELAWEEITEEERIGGGHLTELVFPGFLAYIEGLLLESAPRNTTIVPVARPEAVERILLFLADRYLALTSELGQGADSESLVWARAMTAHLIDLVLYRLYRLTPAEREQLESDG